MAKNASIAIAITTYNRPESCLRLLRDIARDKAGYRVRVVVFDDASAEDYKPVRQFCRTHGWQYVRAAQNHGKRQWWRWVNEVLARWTRDAADHFYFIQDDMRLCSDFFRRTLSLWDQISDQNKAALYLLRDAKRNAPGITCWTQFKSRIEGAVERTQWADCNAILLNRTFLDTLGGALEPIPQSRWDKNPLLSSGVGQQWSQRLHAAKKGMFRPLESYVLHIDEPSHMNPEARRKNPLRAVKFVDGPAAEADILDEYNYVTASLATIPSRRESLKKVVSRLLPQVDHLNVYLNETPAVRGVDEYPDIPKFLDHPKITAVFSQDTKFGDMGDAGKFYWASEVKRGYHVICDDDVLYPPDFVEALTRGVKRYGKKAAVGFHGAVLTEPFKSYYGSRKVYHFTSEVTADAPVHILASNSLCYHTDTIQVHRDAFKHPNMGDIWFGLLAQQQRVPLVCLAHRAKWMVDDVSTRADSIYAHSKHKKASQKNTADVQTRVVRENMPWRVLSPEGKILISMGQSPEAAEAAARRRRAKRREEAKRKAAFLVASTRRPILLAGVLRSLQDQAEVQGWKYDILVSGSASDPSRLIAELAGAIYIPCEGPYPGHKINAMMKETDAELLMLADDDDLQSPWRFRASVEAYLGGALWSSTSGFWCLDQATGRTAWWTGPLTLVGTTISIQRELAVAAGGWPARPEGKDGLFATRVRKVNPTAGCADLQPQIGASTVTIQHSANIHRRRPFPELGKSTRRGKFDVAGREMLGLPPNLRSIVSGVLNDVTPVQRHAEPRWDIELLPVRGPTKEAQIGSEPNQHIARIIESSGTYYERDLLDAIRAHKREGVYVDAGANMGNHTAYFALECPATKVIAIEPQPQSHAELLTTIRANGLGRKVVPVDKAIHPTLREVALVDPSATNRGMVFVTEGQGVPAATLDQILEGYGPIAVLKVDVEGLGAETIASGLATLRRDLPLIACEAETPEEQHQVDAVLRPLGYRRSPRAYCRTPTFLWLPPEKTRG
jgi:FkbM family methyltransferase